MKTKIALKNKLKNKHLDNLSKKKTNFQFQLTNFYALLFILLSSSFILAIPHTIRFFQYDNVMPGSISYYNTRMAEMFESQGVINYDSLSYGGRPYFFDPYHLLIAKVGKYISILAATKLIPFILGVISSLLFFLILKNFGISVKHNFLATILFVFSPIYIDSFVFSQSFSFAILLFLLAFYLFMKENIFVNFVSMILFLTMPLFGIAHVICSTLLILFYAIKYSKMKKFWWVFTPVLVFSIIYLIPLYTQYYVPNPSFVYHNLFSLFISGLGIYPGISLFSIISFFIAIFMTWTHKKELYPIYLLSSLFIIGALFIKSFILYLNLIVSIFAAITILKLSKAKWEIKLIKNLTILVLICGILFSTVSEISIIVTAQPDSQIMSSLTWLSKNAVNRNAIVLSHYSNGYIIEYWSKLPVFMDENYNFYSDAQLRYNISNEIFYSRDLKKTKALMSINHITYIYINNEMKSGKVWVKPEEGLLLLLKDNETFNMIYNNSDSEIWQFLPDKK